MQQCRVHLCEWPHWHLQLELSLQTGTDLCDLFVAPLFRIPIGSSSFGRSLRRVIQSQVHVWPFALPGGGSRYVCIRRDRADVLYRFESTAYTELNTCPQPLVTLKRFSAPVALWSAIPRRQTLTQDRFTSHGYSVFTHILMRQNTITLSNFELIELPANDRKYQ